MKQLLLFICLIGFYFGTTQSFTKQQRLDHLKRLQDSTTWDAKHFAIDQQVTGLDMAGPFELAAFPVPKYELLTGEAQVALGHFSSNLTLDHHKLYSSAFYMYKNPVNADVLGDLENMVFFQIIVLCDDSEPDAQSVVWSRNHPDYFGQGYVKSNLGNIEYAAFITAEGQSFAIVNTRLFNLSYGRTIVIAPQKDGTLRSLQLALGDMEKDGLQQHNEQLLSNEHLKRLLESPGTPHRP